MTTLIFEWLVAFHMQGIMSGQRRMRLLVQATFVARDPKTTEADRANADDKFGLVATGGQT